ncbi:aldo/keto reductase [Cellulomonas soli]|uniref:aldo/keto reductase n=1 Tax=Cellulomonas soli TaxID=931535 RepID=UPI003F868AD7
MTTTSPVPVIPLSTGISMPALGLGVFQSAPADTAAAVETALGAGYRLIDTAAVYFNEREVGEGVRRSGVDRSELFLTTKLWISDYGDQRPRRAFEDSLRRLGTDYVDLYLLHQPLATEFDRTVAAYEAAERLLAAGRVRAIGVSNFLPAHLDALLARTQVVPAVNQVELHPYFTQNLTQSADTRRGIVTQAWSPLGGVTRYSSRDRSAAPDVLRDPVLTGIAQEHGATVAQVVLRWHLQQGRSAIPKSITPRRIVENLDVLGFELTADELARIDALNTGERGGPHPATLTRRSMPITIGRGPGWWARRGLIGAFARRQRGR